MEAVLLQPSVKKNMNVGEVSVCETKELQRWIIEEDSEDSPAFA